MKRFWLMFAMVANLVLADQVVKEVALRRFVDHPLTVIDGFFDLVLVRNRGCAWGMLQGQVWPLAVFGLAALAFLVWKRRAFFGDAWVLPALLYAGIIGNLVDRLFRGAVIDMFDCHWGAWHFPCFNVADSCITVAAVWLVVAAGFGKDDHAVKAETA